MSTVIRRARADDIKKMVEFGRSFWEQTSYYKENNIEYDEERTTQLTRSLISDSGIVQVAYDDNKVVGIVLMLVGAIPYQPTAKVATELVFYVHPDYRERGIGHRLLKQSENVAKQLGVHLMSMIHLDSVSPDKAESVYDSMGYKKTETVFTKEL